jgi:hypothetical protein
MKSVRGVAIVVGLSAIWIEFAAWATMMNAWYGLTGYFLAFVFAPVSLAFPFIWWSASSSFPAFHFGVLAVLIASAFVARLTEDRIESIQPALEKHEDEDEGPTEIAA